MISGFLGISLISLVVIYYINKIDSNEENIIEIKENLKELLRELRERFNYLNDIYNLKVEIEMLKKVVKKRR